MMYRYNMLATQQANKHYLSVQFDSDAMRLVTSVANGRGSYAMIDVIDSPNQVDNLLKGIFIDIHGPGHDLYLQLRIDNHIVINANFKNMNQEQFSEKASECANEIKQAISNRNLHQQVSHGLRRPGCTIV